MKSHSESKFGRGRPSKYSPKAIEVSWDYLQYCAKNNVTPFIEELAMKIAVNDSTLWHWANKHEEFGHVYDMILTLQKLDLKRKALSGQYVSRIACLLLSSGHNVVARQRNEKEATVKEERNDVYTPEQRIYISEAITKIFEQVNS